MLETLHTAVGFCNHGMRWSMETGHGDFGTNQNFLILLLMLSNHWPVPGCAVGALCSPVTFSSASRWDGSFSADQNWRKPSNNKEGVEVWMLKAREQCSSHQGDTSQYRDSWVTSVPALGFRRGGWRGYIPLHSTQPGSGRKQRCLANWVTPTLYPYQVSAVYLLDPKRSSIIAFSKGWAQMAAALAFLKSLVVGKYPWWRKDPTVLELKWCGLWHFPKMWTWSIQRVHLWCQNGFVAPKQPRASFSSLGYSFSCRLAPVSMTIGKGHHYWCWVSLFLPSCSILRTMYDTECVLTCLCTKKWRECKRVICLEWNSAKKETRVGPNNYRNS